MRLFFFLFAPSITPFKHDETPPDIFTGIAHMTPKPA